VWAVGSDLADGSPVILHYDGSAWTRVPTPSSRRGQGALFAVTASSARRAWAVGARPHNAPLIERWNGTEWKLRRAGSMAGYLLAVTTVPGAPTVWAVGNQIERYC
jgi:hypothetical protein